MRKYNSEHRELRKLYYRAYYKLHRDKILVRTKSYHTNNKEKAYKAQKDYRIKNRIKCNVCSKISRDKRFNKSPWLRNYYAARKRCIWKKGDYYKIGIKFLISEGQVKQLWFRDKAGLMRQPSIDRINPTKDYTIGNCRFMELLTHCKRFRMGQAIRALKSCNKESLNEAIQILENWDGGARV